MKVKLLIKKKEKILIPMTPELWTTPTPSTEDISQVYFLDSITF